MAVSYFPLIALLMSVPFMLLEYHRFGALSFFKGVVVYSFVLYMTCAYCLIILPLPDVEEVAKYTSPWCNFIPFRAVYDFFHDSPFRLTQPATWLKALRHKSFYTVAFNLVLRLEEDAAADLSFEPVLRADPGDRLVFHLPPAVPPV